MSQLQSVLPHGFLKGLNRIPLHLITFSALGFGFEFMARHVWYAPFVWLIYFGAWRAYQERIDYSEGEDTASKAVIDFASQFIGAASGILVAYLKF